MTTDQPHPLFPTSSQLLGASRPKASTSKSPFSIQKITNNPSPSTSTPAITPPRSCRRPSPLRNNSFCSDDLDREYDEIARGRKGNQEEDDEDSEDAETGMTSSFCESVDETPESHFMDDKKGRSTSDFLSARPREMVRPPKRRDSGSEVEDVLGGGRGLGFGSPFVRVNEPVDITMKEPGATVETSRIRPTASTSASMSPMSTMSMNRKPINYNPAPTKSTSFIRPKPSFPRSAPLRPLTLALSSSHTTGSSGSGPGVNSVVGTGGRYSTPHAGMSSAQGKNSAAAAAAGRQKVIVPKKVLRMSFDLGLTQSELAREG